MSQAPIFRATVNPAGLLVFADISRWRSYIRSHAGHELDIIARRHHERRSSSQNRWYFGVIVPRVAQHLREATGRFGITGQQAHEFLKAVFLGAIESPLGPIPRTTRTLTVEEFSNYCTAIQAHAASEWGMVIPNPGEAEPEDYEDIREAM